MTTEAALYRSSGISDDDYGYLLRDDLQAMIRGDIYSPLSGYQYQVAKEKRRRSVDLITAYSSADPVLMFSPGIHDVNVTAAGESTGQYTTRPKFARSLVSRVLESRLHGCASLPRRYETSKPYNLDPLTAKLDLTLIQTVAENSGTAFVRPVYDFAAGGGVFYQVFGSDEITPYVTPTGQLGGIVLEWDSYREIWTESTFAVYRDKVLLQTGPNPYGRIPGEVFRVRTHPRQFWGIPDLAVVTLNNIAVNKQAGDLIQLATDQSWAIYVVYEDDEDGGEHAPTNQTDSESGGDTEVTREDLRWTSGNTVFVPNKGKVETLSPDADIKGISTVVDMMSQKTLDDAYLVDVAQVQSGQSGFSLVVRSQPYLNKCRSIRSLIGPATERLIEFAAVVEFAGATRQRFAKQKSDFKVSIFFDEKVLTPKPVEEQVLAMEFERRVGAASTVDIVQKTRNVTRDEAEEIVRRVAADQLAGLNGPATKETKQDEESTV